MNNVHLIIDFMFLYYKYTFMLRSGRLQRLNGIDLSLIPERFKDKIDSQEFDTSTIYYVIKEIEKIISEYEECVTVSICFDAPAPERKSLDVDYKSNRASNRLSEEDFLRIEMIRELFKLCGFNVYYKEGTEADDIVYNLIRKYRENFGFNIIVTPDADLLVNIQEKVGVSRYKTGKGYTAIGRRNFEQYCSAEYKCRVPYNAILLYKSLCGDKSDLVKGIKGFGGKAFDRYLGYLDTLGIDYSELRNGDIVRDLINKTSDYFGSNEKVEEAIHSLDLVIPKEFDIEEPVVKTIVGDRKRVYIELGMPSLAK